MTRTHLQLVLDAGHADAFTLEGNGYTAVYLDLDTPQEFANEQYAAIEARMNRWRAIAK